MNKKHKIRLVCWIITREAVVTMAGIILVALISALVTAINPAESRTISVQSVTTTNQNVIGPEYQPTQRVSTMQLMITGKEFAKGDREKKYQQKVKAEQKIKKYICSVLGENFDFRGYPNWNKVDITELEQMAHLIYGEAGDQGDECQQTVGKVVLNRKKSKFYPNSIESVIFQRGQYACTWDGNYDRKPSKQAYKNALKVLTGNCIKVPENVLYQAQFTQGSGIWRKIGTETFCFK